MFFRSGVKRFSFDKVFSLFVVLSLVVGLFSVPKVAYADALSGWNRVSDSSGGKPVIFCARYYNPSTVLASRARR